MSATGISSGVPVANSSMPARITSFRRDGRPTAAPVAMGRDGNVRIAREYEVTQ
ncbi:hypothetical protein GCM10009547_15990 [Sporichthya brevicatena]|uniref:Uncharacterized protein n=1 Tax=Sporichthya brevicatena TaxID=171442 RepID=A0ABN1GN06_9ACTN